MDCDVEGDAVAGAVDVLVLIAEVDTLLDRVGERDRDDEGDIVATVAVVMGVDDRLTIECVGLTVEVEVSAVVTEGDRDSEGDAEIEAEAEGEGVVDWEAAGVSDSIDPVAD